MTKQLTKTTVTKPYTSQALLFACLLLLVYSSQVFTAATPANISHSFHAFNVKFSIEILDNNPEHINQIVNHIKQEVLFREQAWNGWQSGPLGRVNLLLPNLAWFSFAPSTRDIILKAKKLAITSDHYFNPALGKLTRLWGFHLTKPANKTPPNKEQIDKLMQNPPRMDHLQINGIRMKSSHPDLFIDLKQIAHGQILNEIIEILTHYGVKNAKISAANNFKVIGKNKTQNWSTRINLAGQTRQITIKPNEAFFILNNKDQQYHHNGQSYHALLNPFTGYPVTDTQTVIIIHEDAAVADAASAAIFAAGPKNWQKIAKQLGIQYALLLDNTSKLHMSLAMQQRLKQNRD